jgi:hypothetical protein
MAHIATRSRTHARARAHTHMPRRTSSGMGALFFCCYWYICQNPTPLPIPSYHAACGVCFSDTRHALASIRVCSPARKHARPPASVTSFAKAEHDLGTAQVPVRSWLVSRRSSLFACKLSPASLSMFLRGGRGAASPPAARPRGLVCLCACAHARRCLLDGLDFHFEKQRGISPRVFQHRVQSRSPLPRPLGRLRKQRVTSRIAERRWNQNLCTCGRTRMRWRRRKVAQLVGVGHRGTAIGQRFFAISADRLDRSVL